MLCVFLQQNCIKIVLVKIMLKVVLKTASVFCVDFQSEALFRTLTAAQTSLSPLTLDSHTHRLT